MLYCGPERAEPERGGGRGPERIIFRDPAAMTRFAVNLKPGNKALAFQSKSFLDACYSTTTGLQDFESSLFPRVIPFSKAAAQETVRHFA